MICVGARTLVTLLLVGTASSTGALAASELTPQQVYRAVSPNVVVIEVYGEGGATIAEGSGVAVPNRREDVTTIATNCHVVADAELFVGVRSGDNWGLAWVTGRDEGRDLCLLDALIVDGSKNSEADPEYIKLPGVQVGSSQWLEVGTPVYAIGAPLGLELSLSNGLVSGFREYRGHEFIQTTAPISSGSSGGGLFDSLGRLVGITTMFLRDSQALNFAIPAEWIASVPNVRPPENSGAPATGSSTPPPPPVRASGRLTGDDRWLYVTTNDDDGDVFLDRRSMSRSGSQATVWWKVAYAAPITDKWGDTYDESSTLTRVHCTNRTLTGLQFVQRSNGKVVYSHEHRPYEQRPSHVQPDTVGETLLEMVCRL